MNKVCANDYSNWFAGRRERHQGTSNHAWDAEGGYPDPAVGAMTNTKSRDERGTDCDKTTWCVEKCCFWGGIAKARNHNRRVRGDNAARACCLEVEVNYG